MKTFDAIALGTCYVDINLSDYPFGATGIPVEIELIGDTYETVAGGSAVNFCRLLTTCGLQTAFIGMAGNDPHGNMLETLLQEDGTQSLLVRQPELLTNISFNMTNTEGKHILLTAGTANQALAPETVLPQLEVTLDDASTLYMGGCFKLTKLAPAYQQIAEAARRHDTALVVDHGRIPSAATPEMHEAVKRLVLGASYYLPSRDEFCQLWDVANIEQALEQLHITAPDLRVVVKDGADGAHYWADGAIQTIQPPKVDKVIQATGAGDSFNAGFMAAIARNHPLKEAVAYGCAVAAAKIAGQPIPRLQ